MIKCPHCQHKLHRGDVEDLLAQDDIQESNWDEEARALGRDLAEITREREEAEEKRQEDARAVTLQAFMTGGNG